MSSKRFLWVYLFLIAAIGLLVVGGQREAVAAPIRLVYMTAGDVNMLALGQNVLGPAFAKKYPEVSLMTVHTGPGDPGSRLIFEKLSAEAESKKESSDVDVAMVHQMFMKWADGKDLLLNYAKGISTWKYVTSPFAKMSLGVNVEGFVMPMFHSQTALAYNPDYVKDPPKT